MLPPRRPETNFIQKNKKDVQEGVYNGKRVANGECPHTSAERSKGARLGLTPPRPNRHDQSLRLGPRSGAIPRLPRGRTCGGIAWRAAGKVAPGGPQSSPIGGRGQRG